MGPQSLESGFQLDSIKDALWHKAKKPPNIFCLHTRWNGQSVASLYTQKKPFYFSILRDPVSLFISLWDYYGVSKKLNDVTLQEFAMSSNKPEKLIMPGWVSSNAVGKNALSILVKSFSVLCAVKKGDMKCYLIFQLQNSTNIKSSDKMPMT